MALIWICRWSEGKGVYWLIDQRFQSIILISLWTDLRNACLCPVQTHACTCKSRYACKCHSRTSRHMQFASVLFQLIIYWFIIEILFSVPIPLQNGVVRNVADSRDFSFLRCRKFGWHRRLHWCRVKKRFAFPPQPLNVRERNVFWGYKSFSAAFTSKRIWSTVFWRDRSESVWTDANSCRR